jgi:thiol-disulfide isomerase/thioredoxin
MKGKHTLLVFYQSGCGPCEELMAGLKTNYKELVAQGLEIVSLSSDLSEDVFKNAAAQFPWENKYCDLKGMSGINFENYAVLGTPTLFLLNNKGEVLQKMVTISEVLEWSKKNKT